MQKDSEHFTWNLIQTMLGEQWHKPVPKASKPKGQWTLVDFPYTIIEWLGRDTFH